MERVAQCIRQHHPQYSNETVHQVEYNYIRCTIHSTATKLYTRYSTITSGSTSSRRQRNCTKGTVQLHQAAPSSLSTETKLCKNWCTLVLYFDVIKYYVRPFVCIINLKVPQGLATNIVYECSYAF